MGSKTCTTCKTERPLTDFYNDVKMSDGKKNRCKECERKRKGFKTKNITFSWYQMVLDKQKIEKISALDKALLSIKKTDV